MHSCASPIAYRLTASSCVSCKQRGVKSATSIIKGTTHSSPSCSLADDTYTLLQGAEDEETLKPILSSPEILQSVTQPLSGESSAAAADDTTREALSEAVLLLVYHLGLSLCSNHCSITNAGNGNRSVS